MTTVRFHSPDGPTVALVEVKPGQSLMLAALAANVPGIEAECGGSLACATCHVYVSDEHVGSLPPASEEEQEMLGFVAAERRPNSRLSCQLVGTKELELIDVHLPDRQVAA